MRLINNIRLVQFMSQFMANVWPCAPPWIIISIPPSWSPDLHYIFISLIQNFLPQRINYGMQLTPNMEVDSLHDVKLTKPFFQWFKASGKSNKALQWPKGTEKGFLWLFWTYRTHSKLFPLWLYYYLQRYVAKVYLSPIYAPLDLTWKYTIRTGELWDSDEWEEG